MPYFAKTGMVRFLEDFSTVYMLALGQAKNLVKLFTKTRRQMRNAREIDPESGLVLNHHIDLALLSSHLFRQAY